MKLGDAVQRTIKFRAWDTQLGRFRNVRFASNDGSLYDPDCEDGFETVFEQWTGLKDKKGAEIYEGDILSTATAGPVVWVKDSYQCGGKYQFRLWEEALYGEVIGNIHENPELLWKP